jgi:hypothetical protein
LKMIKKYSDFLNENLEFILESNVVYSDSFRKAMTKIDHPIAKAILGVENDDLNVQANYLDVEFSKNDTITFTPDRKAKEILGDTKEVVRFIGSGGGWLKHTDSNKELFNKLNYTFEEGSEPYKPNSRDLGEVVDKVTSETSGKVYAWVKFKDESGNEVGEGVYNVEKIRVVDERIKKVWSSNRQEVKVGRAMRALLKLAGGEFADKDFESFVNLYKATIDKMNDKFSFFEEVTGEKIYFWYNYQNYYQRTGTLGNSCMANARASWLEIYTENPDQVSLVIFKSQEDNDKIVGRALLWTLQDGKRFMDRIYAINDSDVQLFRDYAKENGWYSKYNNNSSDDNSAYAPDGSTVNLDLTVNLDKKDYSNYPYLDTLKYFREGRGILSSEQKGDYITLEDTGGDYVRSCDTCDGSGRTQCYDCDGDGTVSCNNCDGEGSIECNSCDGDGKEDCSTCDGSGNVEGSDGEEEECSDCDGTGKMNCTECDGEGERTCRECDGDETVECGPCDGRGTVDCYDC